MGRKYGRAVSIALVGLAAPDQGRQTRLLLRAQTGRRLAALARAAAAQEQDRAHADDQERRAMA